MTKFLFLDDIRMPKDTASYSEPALRPMYLNHKWDIVRSYDQFIEYILENGVPDVISFDHDLAPEHYRESMYATDGRYNKYYHDGTFKIKTGYDAAVWLVDHCIKNDVELPECFIHSMNPTGCENIAMVLEGYYHLKFGTELVD